MAKGAFIGVPTIIPANTPLGDKAVGDIVKLNVGGVAVDFIVVHHGNPDATMYDEGANGTWLLMKEVYENRALDSTNNDYKNSDIHAYLNGDFIGLFDSDIQGVIKQVKIPYVNGTGSGGSVTSGANGLSTKAFLLGVYEVGWTSAVQDYFPIDGTCLAYFLGTATKDSKRNAYKDGTNVVWRLRSARIGQTGNSMSVSIGGSWTVGSVTTTYGIRPALILPSNLGVEEDGTVLSTPASSGSETPVEVAREVKQMFIGVNGVARKVKAAWVGVNGVARLFFGGGLALSELPEGALVSINESGLPILFYVGKHDYESGLNGAGRVLVTRKDLWGTTMYWNEAGSDRYSGSTVDTWLNSDYKNLFSEEVKTLVGETTFVYTEGGHSYKDHNSGSTLTTLSRSVFLLSFTEFGKSRSKGYNIEGSALPIASLIADNSVLASQWTRTIYWDSEDNRNYALPVSGTVTQVNYRKHSVRPAFTLPSNALVNPEPNADGSYTLLV